MRNSKNILSLIIMLLILLLGVAAYNIKNYGMMDNDFLGKEGKHKIEEIIKEYIVANPEIILDSMANLRQKQQNSAPNNVQYNMKDKREMIESIDNNPVQGASDADIVITELYDYRCGYCKKSSAVLARLVEDDPKIKIIYKEFPILGEKSVNLARIALAVNIVDPTKFVLFHNKLMGLADPHEGAIKNILKDLNINYEQIITKAKEDVVTEILEKNRELVRNIEIAGTPTVIINGELVSDPYSIENLRNIVNRLREAK